MSETDVFDVSPFLRDLAQIVREGQNKRRADASSNENTTPAEDGSSFEADRAQGLPFFSYLAPDVQARLAIVIQEADARYATRECDVATSYTTAASDSGGEGTAYFREDGRLDWSRVAILPDAEADDVEALAACARLAVSCLEALRDIRRHACPLARRLRDVHFVAEWIAFGTEEQAYVALCICSTLLEKALYGVYSSVAGGTSRNTSSAVDVGCGEALASRSHPCASSDGSRVEGEGSCVPSAMILRDLIAKPLVKAALPEQMPAILRLLFLPPGFNIRNLVWHGFLAPSEAPRELAALVLVLTQSIPMPRAGQNGEAPVMSRLPTSISTGIAGGNENPNPGPPDGFRDAKAAPAIQSTTRSSSPHAPDRGDATRSAWALHSFDDRLACSPVLAAAIEVVLSEEHRSERQFLVEASTFVPPGRKGLVFLAFCALRDGLDTLFLVAILPVLEHGLRCVFSCANDSSGHLFAQLRQYYSTLDGFGQRARHQLLLDQELSGHPGRSNLLLHALGPGLSACLLDLFMMSAGPNLRGKVAHGEIDITASFPAGDHGCCARRAGKDNGRRPSLVVLATAVFITLCSRYAVGGCGATTVAAGVRGGGTADGDNEEKRLCRDCRAHRSGEDRPAGGDPPKSARSDPDVFATALQRCDEYLSGWVPRFHPHELLEAELQRAWTAFEGLAAVLERRAIRLERLPGVEDLACMSVTFATTSQQAEGDDAEGPPAAPLVLPDPPRQNDGSSAGKVVCQGLSDEPSRKKRGSGVDEGGHPGALLTLTITDKAHRLLPRADLTAACGTRRLDARVTGHEGKSGGWRRQAISARNDLSAELFEVDVALAKHVVRFTERFASIGAAGGPDGVVEVSGVTRRCLRSPAETSRIGRASWHKDVDGWSSRGNSSSAFVAYMHSLSCPDFEACEFDCLLHEQADTLVSRSELTPASALYDHEGLALPREPQSVDSESDGTANTTTGACSDGEKLRGSDDRDGPVSASASVAQGPRRSRVEPGLAGPFPRRRRRRISPLTDVAIAVPLPQIACMSSLCHSSARITLRLQERLHDLESLHASGEASTGKRRAYAETLRVAPTVLRFLALAVACVESFVLDWACAHRPPCPTGVEPAPADGPTFTAPRDGSRPEGSLNPPLSSSASPLSSSSPGAVESPTERAASVKSRGDCESKLPKQERHHDGRAFGVSHLCPCLLSRSRIPCGTRSSPQGRRQLEARLSFLRRLTAVIGALGLCVPRHALASHEEVSPQVRGAPARRDSRSADVHAEKTPAGVQRKGYVQALKELASFLETTSALRGFSADPPHPLSDSDKACGNE